MAEYIDIYRFLDNGLSAHGNHSRSPAIDVGLLRLGPHY